MGTSVLKGRPLFAGLAVALSLAAGSVWAQDIIIDAATGQPIQLNGIGNASMETLRGGGQITARAPGGNQVVIRGELYKPGTWIDPDGCEHWVMDDGIEGYMAPKLTRDGYPICNGGSPQPGQLMVRMYDQPYHGKYGSKW